MRADLDRGTVLLDPDELDILLTVPDEEADPEVLAVRGDERLAAVLSAVAEPVVQVRCVIARDDVVSEHRLWVNRAAAGVLAEGEKGLLQLSGLHPSAVPALLARLIGLGPRRVEREPIPTEPDVVADLLNDSDLLRTSALAVVAAQWAWTIDVAHGSDERGLAGVDGSDGLALLEEIDGADVLRPATATEVFRMLTTVLV